MKKYLTGLPSSAIFLLVANLVPIFGVIFLRWDLVDILFLYWAESAIIGFYNILKILSNTGGNRGWMYVLHLINQLFFCTFFTVHYGAFMFGHALVLYAIAHEFFGIEAHPLDLLSATWVALATLFISHGYSFAANFIIKGERMHASEGEFMYYPYLRIIVMHSTLIFGVMLVLLFGQPILLLLLFMMLKTGVDMWAHLRERRRFILK